MLGRSSPYCWTFVEEKTSVEEKLNWEIFVEWTLMKRTLMRKVLLRKTVLRDLLLRGHLMKKLLLRKGDGQNGSIWQNYFGSFRNWARLVLNYSFLQGQYLIGDSLRTIAGRGWGRSAALRWSSLPRVLSGSFAFHLTTTRRSGISTHLLYRCLRTQYGVESRCWDRRCRVLDFARRRATSTPPPPGEVGFQPQRQVERQEKS